MNANPVHTGDMAKIREWFESYPEEQYTTNEMAEIFDLHRWQVNNAFMQLQRKNIIIKCDTRSEGRGHQGVYRLRKPDEKREEFKVAVKAVVHNPPKQKKVEITRPVLTECDPAMASRPLRRMVNQYFSTAAQNGRVQFLDANTIIVWNSSTQLDEMRQRALCE